MSATTDTAAALAAARARHAELAEAAAEARDDLARARADRQGLLDRTAAGGIAVTTADLRAADKILTGSAHRHELAIAIETSGRRRVEEAEIAHFRAEAENITASVQHGYGELHRAADALDRAISEAQATLVALQDARAELVQLSHRGGLLAEDVRRAARTNSILAAMPPAQAPRVQPVATAPSARDLRFGLMIAAFGDVTMTDRPAASFVMDIPRPA